MTSAITQPAQCLRCGRKLTAQASIARGYGPVCRARIAAAPLVSRVLDGFSGQQREKIAELIADAGIVPTRRPGVYRTVSSRGDAVYLSVAQACNCPGGLRTLRKPCYHSGGVRLIEASRRAA